MCVWEWACSVGAGESCIWGVCLLSCAVKIATDEAYHQSAEEATSGTPRKPPAENITPNWGGGVERVGVVKNMGIRNVIYMENSSSLACVKCGPGEGWLSPYP